MIDINKMRRLAQAATPGPWVAAGPSFGESLPKYLNEVAVDREGDEDDGYSICNAPIGLNEECSDDMAFIAEANPLTIEELLDRLEAAEKSRDDLLAGLGEWLDKTKWVQQGVNEGTISAKYLGLHRADVMSSLLGEAEKARDALRAKIEQMERQEPVAAQHRFRHPQKTMPNWSTWQPCAISNRPAWEIDWQSYEVEYRPLYAHAGAKGESE